MNKPKEYHLPNNAYWVSSSIYNGLSKRINFHAASEPLLGTHTRVSTLKSNHIPQRIKNLMQ